MNIFIPNYRESFRVTEPGTLNLKAAWRFRSPNNEDKDFSDIYKLTQGDTRMDITLPVDTILEVKSIRVRRSEYVNFITFEAFHEDFVGIQYKTVGKVIIDVYEQEFKQLKNLEVEIIDDTDN